MKNEVLTEQLLDAWLKLSSVISNNRLVSGFSFNEAFVLNLLYKHQLGGEEKKLTATDLCRQTHVLKSQMNAILTSLEKKDMIIRKRSSEDRRQIAVELKEDAMERFMECHNRSLYLVNGLIQQIGEKEGTQAVAMLNRLAAGFEDVLAEVERKKEAD